jgi:seryl-tRNA(Sec) selenium transferase
MFGVGITPKKREQAQQTLSLRSMIQRPVQAVDYQQQQDCKSNDDKVWAKFNVHIEKRERKPGYKEIAQIDSQYRKRQHTNNSGGNLQKAGHDLFSFSYD